MSWIHGSSVGAYWDDCSASSLVTDQKIKISSASPLDAFRFYLCIAYSSTFTPFSCCNEHSCQGNKFSVRVTI
jgi:hypothetical protein